MTIERLRKLLEQIEALETTPGSTAMVNVGDADEAEDKGLIERDASNAMRLTSAGKSCLAELRTA